MTERERKRVEREEGKESGERQKFTLYDDTRGRFRNDRKTDTIICWKPSLK